MSIETALRDHLVKLLTSGWAHVTPEDGIAGVPPDQREMLESAPPMTGMMCSPVEIQRGR